MTSIAFLETHRTFDWDVLPVRVDASVFLPAGLAAAHHQVREAGPPHAGLLPRRGQQQLLGKNDPRNLS